ncbi:MAG: enoyl-ACP reductase [Armatimonadetes bacterium]|nr:enoyl-ACP reductase [Armatimonadota bacterium]MDE2205427.1 enoyl-ACP reductase [Armatimonadota bacterium]
MPEIFEGKTVLITGVQNRWSIAWHAACALHSEGARLLFSVLGEKAASNLGKLLDEHQIVARVYECDAADEQQCQSMFRHVRADANGRLDGVVHSIAYANRDELNGEFVATSPEGFAIALDRSAYTLVRLARGARPLMQEHGGAIVALTYLGAVRAVPNYNVMGVAKATLEACARYLAADLGPEQIRVNSVSAGPIKTAAASAIAGFDTMIKNVAGASPLRRPVAPEEIASAVMFLLSPWSSGITGQVVYTDCGYSIVAHA